MLDLSATIRALVTEPRGFTTSHPSLAAWSAVDVGHAAKALMDEGVLVRWRGTNGHRTYLGAHLPRPARLVVARPQPIPPAVVLIVDVLRRLALRCPLGFGTRHADLAAHWSSETVGKSAAHLVRRGELFKVRASHKLVYYFRTLELASAASARLLANNTMGTRAHTHVSVQSPRVLTGAPDFSRAKLTVCPPFVPRFIALDVICPLLYQAPHRRAA